MEGRKGRIGLKMEGVPQSRERWDGNVLPSLVGRYLLTGAERKGADELVRSPNDAVKSKLCADAYLHAPA